MEIWDLYDINRIKTGKVIERGDKIPDDFYHMVVHVCIFNSKNEMLIQQRQPFKKGWSNMWDLTVGGHAVSGDSSQSAAERELFEEIGYKADFTNIKPNFSLYFNVGFDDYYLLEADIEIDKLILQYEEVQSVKWVSKSEILKMIDNGNFIPYFKSVIEMCFDMKGRYGSHSK